MEQALNETVSIPIMGEQRMRRQLSITGREGLQNLLDAIRRMVGLLLAPFRTIAKVIYKFSAGAGQSVDQSGVGTGVGSGLVDLSKTRPEGDGGMDDVAAFGVDSDVRQDDPDAGVAMRKLLDKVQTSGGGTLELVMTGAPEELQAVLPMLLRHVDQILAAHLPTGADEAKLTSRLVALAETSESARYAHRIVSRQVGVALKGLVGSEQYMGLSEATVIELVRAGGKRDGSGIDLGGRSAEEQLLAALQLRDKLERDFSGQAHQMARLIADVAGTEEPKAGEPDSQKRLLTKALEAAEIARFKLRIHEGGTVGLSETLPEMRDELLKVVAEVRNAAAERTAVVAALPAAAPEQAADVDAAVKPADGEQKGKVAEQLAEQVTAAAAHVPQAPAAAVKAAAMAKVVRVAAAGGMFGGQPQAPRSAKEMAEAAEELDFEMEDEGGEQPFVAG